MASEDDEATADTLDWSVSCISGALANGNGNLRTDLSDFSSGPASPKRQSSSDFQVMERLLQTMQSLVGANTTNPRAIEDEPELSFQCLAIEDTQDEDGEDDTKTPTKNPKLGEIYFQSKRRSRFKRHIRGLL